MCGFKYPDDEPAVCEKSNRTAETVEIKDGKGLSTAPGHLWTTATHGDTYGRL